MVFLALLLLASAVLALLGYDLGPWMLAWLVGFLVGWVAAYLLTKPRRYHGWVAVALGAGVLTPFLVSVFGLARGIGWLDIVGPYDSVWGAVWIGLVFAIIQVVFGRFSGRGFWAEN